MKQDSLVISNKLKPPHLRSELRRPRLIALGYQDDEKRLMTIMAGPGYGKTTLMAQIAESRLGDTLWYQIDAMDADPMVFLRHIVYGISNVAGIDTKRSKQRLEYIEDIESEGEQIAELLCRELAEQIRTPLTICLDDCHLLQDQCVLRILTAILENQPHDAYVILSSRSTLDLPLGKYRTAGVLREIRRQDLLFSPEEIRSLLKDVWGLTPLDEVVDQLRRRVGGWPAGLVLLEAHIRMNNSIPTLFTNHRIRKNIFDYLAEEALAGLAPDMREVMMHCALLDPVDTDIAMRVMDNPDVDTLLKKAESLNLFISNVDGTSNYRYHPLFKDYLMHVLGERKGSGYVSELQVKYGKELERAGDWAGAIQQYLNAERTDRAVPLLEIHGSDMFRDGEYKTLGRWLEAIEPDEFTPALLLSLGRIKMISGLTEDALEILTEAESRIDDPTQRCECSLTIAECLGELGRWSDGIDVLGRVETDTLNQREKLEVVFCKGFLYFYGFDNEKLKECCDEAKLIVNATPDQSLRHRASYMRTMKYFREGRFANALSLLQKVSKISELQGNQRTAHLNNIASCLLLTAKYEPSIEYASECLDCAEEINDKTRLSSIYDTLGCSYYGAGDWEKAITLINKSIDLDISEDDIAKAIAYCHLGTFHRWEGQSQEALDLHQRGYQIAKALDEKYDELMCLSNISADLIELEDYRQARLTIKKVRREAAHHGFGYILTRLDFHRACSAHKRGTVEMELDSLSSALMSASRNMQNHFLIHESKNHLLLLHDAIIHNIHTDYVCWLLKMMGAKALPVAKEMLESKETEHRYRAVDIINDIADPKTITLIRRVTKDPDDRVKRCAKKTLTKLRKLIERPSDIMTAREIQIMELLALGSSNASIAENLFISEQTVKTHITNIFRKLGLYSRLEVALYYQREIRK